MDPRPILHEQESRGSSKHKLWLFAEFMDETIGDRKLFRILMKILQILYLNLVR